MPPTDSPKMESTKTADSAGSHAPVVVDVGKKRRKQIRQLRKGRGKLMDEINQLVGELRNAGSISAASQPVVVVVRQKRRNRSLPWS